MKKSYLVAKFVFGLTAGFLVTSCISDPESPILTEQLEKSVVLSEGTTGEENLRKYPEFNYFEKFSNQSVIDEAKPYAFPGFGEGNATFIGKSYSFFNQYATGEIVDGQIVTVGEPVTEYFQDQLTELGLPDVPSSVSSITTDGKGNSLWFYSVRNLATPGSDGITFIASVNIVGGTGKFEGASGSGIVEGYIDSEGKGVTTVKADLKY